MDGQRNCVDRVPFQGCACSRDYQARFPIPTELSIPRFHWSPETIAQDLDLLGAQILHEYPWDVWSHCSICPEWDDRAMPIIVLWLTGIEKEMDRHLDLHPEDVDTFIKASTVSTSVWMNHNCADPEADNSKQPTHARYNLSNGGAES